MKIERLGLIIGKGANPEYGGNINGPCCILAPETSRSKFGKFFLYFSSHSSKAIKLAFSNQIAGPWRIYDDKVLDLKGYKDAYDHIASPDVFKDNENKLRMYFHARSRSRGREQWTYAAVSTDGINFEPLVDSPLAPFYMRIFYFRGEYYGITKGGNIWRSRDGLSAFEQGINLFDHSLSEEIWHNSSPSVRHLALDFEEEERLKIYFSRIGDFPERILETNVCLSPKDWNKWKVTEIREVIRPEEYYEGSGYKVRTSSSGPSIEEENALRDPYLFKYRNKKYLFYTVCGEYGIAVCELG